MAVNELPKCLLANFKKIKQIGSFYLKKAIEKVQI
jgi:hypothetical protein